MKELSDIEKRAVQALIGCVRALNISANLYDEKHVAGAFLISGAEIQRALTTLEAISKKSVAAKAFIKQHFEGLPKPAMSQNEAKKYTG